MLRRRRTLSVTGLAVGAIAAFALGSSTAGAQTPSFDSSVDLLAPLPDNGVNPPPRLRRARTGTVIAQDQAPPSGMFTTPSRIGATPVYGSPPAFGAGDTGYDSTNTGKNKQPASAPQSTFPNQDIPETTFAPLPAPAPKPADKKKRTAPATPAPADVQPAKAASRPGAVLPAIPEALPVSNPPPEVHPLAAANRAGATLPVPQTFDVYQLNANANAPAALPKTPALAPAAPTALPSNLLPFGVLPQRPLPLAEGDAYAPLGMRAGSFVLLPSVDLSGGYTTNASRGGAGSGSSASPYFVGMPELQAVSDWERHSLTADIVGSYTEYGENLVPSLNVPYFSSQVDGRIDVTRNTQIVVENRYLLSTDNPGSPNLQAQLARLPINTDLGGTIGLVQEFNRLSFALLGSYDAAQYDNSLLTDGEQVSNAARNLNQTSGILRLAYDLDPGLKPFVQVEDDTRTHNLQPERNSTGTTVQVGGDVDLFGTLTGEMAGGWLVRSYDDPTMANISGFVANGSLTWQATPLTTAKLSAASEVYETTVLGASGQFTRDLNLEVDHAFLPWIIGILQTGYGTDNYVGSPLRDYRYFVSAGVTYKMTREVQLRTQVRQDWQIATQPGFGFSATSVLVGMRLQR